METGENMANLRVVAEKLPTIPLLRYNVLYGIVRARFKTPKTVLTW
jgi:hypothetical protein